MKFEFEISTPFTSDAVDHLLNDQNWPEDVRPTIIATHNVLSSLIDLEVSRLNESLCKYVKDREAILEREMSELKAANASLSSRLSSISACLECAPRVRIHLRFKPDVRLDAIAIIRTLRKHLGFDLSEAKAAYDNRTCETYAFLVTDSIKKSLESLNLLELSVFPIPASSTPDSH